MYISTADKEFMAKHFDKNELGQGSWKKGEGPLPKVEPKESIDRLVKEHPVGHLATYEKAGKTRISEITEHGTHTMGSHYALMKNGDKVLHSDIKSSVFRKP